MSKLITTLKQNKMARFNLLGNITVAELKKAFNDAFGSQIKVYKGSSEAEDASCLSELGLKEEGVLECRSSLTVGRFIERMAERGLKVAIWTRDYHVKILEGLTLESTGKVKNMARKRDMEDMIAYQRKEDALEESTECEQARIQKILDLTHKILTSGLAGNSYSSHKMAIKKLFEKTETEIEKAKEEVAIANILLRLTVIDSMYSTQMNRRYYALEDLAKAMYAVQTEKNCSLADMFVEFAKSPDVFLFDYSGGNLFGNRYGIGKDGEEKGTAISLISKYAYFATDYQFPIFDSIVCETLPTLSKYLGLNIEESSLKDLDGKERMVRFVSVINHFIFQLDSKISYDTLDRLLWFVGKIRRGNLSLILSKEEYRQCIEYLEAQKSADTEDVVFDIGKINIEIQSLPFIKPRLEPFFELAKELDSLVKYPNKKKTSKRL